MDGGDITEEERKLIILLVVEGLRIFFFGLYVVIFMFIGLEMKFEFVVLMREKVFERGGIK